MPIYEFKCNDCSDVFEILIMKDSESVEMKCPKCNSENFERVLSTTNFAMGMASSGSQSGLQSTSRTCSTGSCTTYDIPGHSR